MRISEQSQGYKDLALNCFLRAGGRVMHEQPTEHSAHKTSYPPCILKIPKLWHFPTFLSPPRMSSTGRLPSSLHSGTAPHMRIESSLRLPRPDIHSLKAHVALFLLLAPSNTVKGRNQPFQLFPVLLMLSVLGVGLAGSHVLSHLLPMPHL